MTTIQRWAMAWLVLLHAVPPVWADASPPDLSCGAMSACADTLPSAWANGTECEDRQLQLFRRQGAPAVLLCATRNQPDDSLVVVLDADRPKARAFIVGGARVLLSLEGILSNGVPDRFAFHPVCPASRGLVADNPGREVGRWILVVKRLAEPYCFDALVAAIGPHGVVLAGAGSSLGRALSMDKPPDAALLALAARALDQAGRARSNRSR